MSVDTVRTFTGYCGFCAVHCPVVTTVDGARIVSVEPDRAHPYGGAICSKGRAAPEFHDHGDRVNVPLRRTRPKTDPDPGWAPCSWDEALDLIAEKLLAVRAADGAQAVAFNKGTTTRSVAAPPTAPPCVVWSKQRWRRPPRRPNRIRARQDVGARQPWQGVHVVPLLKP